MASIELLPRKEFRIITDTETVNGKFGTWALKRFCDKRNYTLNQVSEALGNPLLKDMIEFILCAIEQSFREQRLKESFPYDEIDVCKWIDEFGGIGSEQVSLLFNHAGDEQKKSEPEGG